MAHAHLEKEELELAWPYISEMLNLDMDDVGGLYLLGVFMRKKGHMGIAAQTFRRAVSLDPKPSNIWLHFGCCMHDIHQYDAAMQIWELLKSKMPKDSGVLRNMAGTYLQQGKFHDALNTINRAIEMAGENVPGPYKAIKGMAALGLERWKEGFDNYRGLYGEQLLIRKYCQPEEPEWNGTKGQTIVVQGDQGIGDELRFSSVLPDLARDCTVIFDCHPKLENIMRRSFPQIHVYGTRKKKAVDWLKDHKIDASHHISGLGRFYRIRDKDFPRTPYLVPDQAKQAAWRTKLEGLPKPWVGIAWTGGGHATQREDRSFDLATFIPIIQEGGTFIDLSYHDSKPEVDYFNSLSENKIVRFDIDQSDYDNTLALVAELDLVITVPTTIMHAAGAIGKPCFVFNPAYPNWEFGNRDDMIWYAPGLVRIFRGQIEDVRDAYLHWGGFTATDSLHRIAKLDHSESKQAGTDHAVDPAPAAHSQKGPNRVHF
jgi:hypothetical protein